MYRFLTLICIILLVGCTEPRPRELAITGQTMGTTYMVKFVATNQTSVNIDDLKSQIDEALIRVNQLMSTYDPDSELSVLNRLPANQSFAVSEETEQVLREAMRLALLSEGYLDVTIGPLVNLWGFGPDKRPEKIPSTSELSAVQDYVGINKVSLESGSIKKLHENVYLDLSTIAKGYGVDAVADILQANGLFNYLVEIGGEMKVKGQKANGNTWKIAIEKPITGERAIQKVVSIGDNAIATSGDYRNYYEVDGVRYSHLIDPRTGYPIQHNLVSVTVIHPSSMTADGLATALNVMGANKAKQIVERENLAVFMVTKEGDTFVEYASSEFEKAVVIY